MAAPSTPSPMFLSRLVAIMHKAFTSWRSLVLPGLSPCHWLSLGWWHHFHLTEERWLLDYPSCPYAVSLPIPSRPYQASLVHLPLPQSRALWGYFLMWSPTAYGEWQHAYAPPCTSPYLSQWVPAPWPCWMWITQESHILSSTSLSHLNLKIYMILDGLPLPVTCLKNLILFFYLVKVIHVWLTVTGTFQESLECQLL